MTLFFLDLEIKISGIGSLTNKRDGEWDSTAKNMMQEFAESGHLVFSCSVVDWTDMLRKFRQDANSVMCPETATQQDASSSARRSAADMSFASRSKVKSPPARSSESSSLPVKLLPTPLTGKIRSSVQDHGMQHPPLEEVPCLSRHYSQSRKKFV